jgi:translation elongation factor EF-Tu-like GTPase
MTITDVFRIAGRGTVVTGKLQGTVPLSITDALSCEGSVFQISGIEQFRATLTTVEPPAEIGVLLRDNPPADQLRGRTVSFVPGGAATTTPFTTEPPRKHRWRR